MVFHNPEFLFLLFVLPPLVFFYKKKSGVITFSAIKELKNIFVVSKLDPFLILKFLRLMSLVLFVFALSRPQTGQEFVSTNSEGVDIMLAIDTSQSMLAHDFEKDGKRVDRLTIIKDVVRGFVDKRTDDRMGIVVFGTNAYLQCPVTLDHGMLLDFLDKLKIGMGGDSTAIGDAIGLSVKRIKDIEAKSKIIILLTDGDNKEGVLTPQAATEIAKSLNVKVYTIGIGSRGPVPFPMRTMFGVQFVEQELPIDEDALRKIASDTNGKYYRATDTEEFKKIYDEIDKLEKRKLEVKRYTEYHEQYLYFVLCGLLVLLVEILLANTLLRKIP